MMIVTPLTSMYLGTLGSLYIHDSAICPGQPSLYYTHTANKDDLIGLAS